MLHHSRCWNEAHQGVPSLRHRCYFHRRPAIHRRWIWKVGVGFERYKKHHGTSWNIFQNLPSLRLLVYWWYLSCELLSSTFINCSILPKKPNLPGVHGRATVQESGLGSSHPSHPGLKTITLEPPGSNRFVIWVWPFYLSPSKHQLMVVLPSHSKGLQPVIQVIPIWEYPAASAISGVRLESSLAVQRKDYARYS